MNKFYGRYNKWSTSVGTYDPKERKMEWKNLIKQ